jgi:hypothetical protein
LNKSPSQSSLFEINTAPLEKMVLDKPVSLADAQKGNMDATTLATCVQQATQKSWS